MVRALSCLAMALLAGACEQDAARQNHPAHPGPEAFQHGPAPVPVKPVAPSKSPSLVLDPPDDNTQAGKRLPDNNQVSRQSPLPDLLLDRKKKEQGLELGAALKPGEKNPFSTPPEAVELKLEARF